MDFTNLINFAASVQGIFSLLALLLLVTISFSGLFARGRRNDVLKAVESGNPDLVKQVNNAYNIDVSKLSKDGALTATRTKIMHDTIRLAMRLFFGFVIFLAVLVVLVLLLKPAKDEAKSNTDFLKLAVALQRVGDAETRVDIAREYCGDDFDPLFEFALRDKGFAPADPDSAPPPQIADINDVRTVLQRASGCSRMDLRDGVLHCDGFTTLLDVGVRMPAADPESIVLHYTAAPASPRQLSEMFRTNRVGYHFLIGRDGSITQFANLEFRALHVGRGARVGDTHVGNINSIGIGFDNLGRLDQRGDAYYLAGSDIKVSPRAEPVMAENRLWEPYTEDQREAGRRLISSLREEYGPLLVVGHSDVSPFKEDPGPLLQI